MDLPNYDKRTLQVGPQSDIEHLFSTFIYLEGAQARFNHGFLVL